MSRLQDPRFYVGLNKNLGQEALEQVDRGFAEERDPYGRKWPKSHRAKQQSGQTLTDTARLRRSFSKQGVKATRGSFTVGTSVHYADTHQEGRTIKAKTSKGLRFKAGKRWVTKQQVTIPKRQMIPEGDDLGLWEKPLEEAADLYTEAVLNGA